MTLPPLPEWTRMDDLGGLVPSDIRVSMRAYGEACALAERERCAKLCERNSDKWDTTGGDGGASLECADLIRSAE